MKLNKLLIVGLLFVVVGVFSSCSDTHTKRAQLNIVADVDTNIYGNVPIDFTVTDNDILEYDPRRESLRDIRLFNTRLILFSRSFRPGDEIDIFLKSDSRIEYSVRGVVGSNQEVFVETGGPYGDNLLFDFMDDFMYDLYTRRRAPLYVDIRTYIKQSIRVEFRLESDIDIRVKD